MKKFYLVTLIVLLVDRISKILVENFLSDNITIIKNFFYLTFVRNEGAAFSILLSKRALLIVLAILAIGLIYYYVRKHNKTNIGYSLLMGGIIGNLLDRIIFGSVIDFIGIIIFNNYFPIFNIADIAIVIGAIFIFFEKEEK